ARGVQQAALFNLVATLAKSLPLLLFILFACYWFDPVTFAADQQGSTLAVPVSEQVRNTMLITLWVFTGIEGAAVLSARARNRRDVGTATVLGVVLALLLYVLISVLALGLLSRPELAALPNPSMAGLMAQMTGSWGKLLISVGLIVSVLASYVSWTLFSAEVPFSAARHGAFPAIFRRQNRSGTPIASLWLTSLTVQVCLLLVWLLGKGYTSLLLISTSMILVPYLLIGLFLLKLSFSSGKSEGEQGRSLMRVVALVSSGYGFWLLYAAGVEYLLLSLLLYGPGLLLFLYSRRQLGADLRLSGRERWLAGVTLLSLIPAVWSFTHL
ncbi:MAG: amino acid permease, partial [Aeromonas sobria]